MITIILYILIGAIAGTMAGLLGIGGGIVVVPGLAFVFESYGLAPGAVMHLAEGTSLATMIFTSFASTFSHHRRRAILWPLFLQLAPGIILGTIAGALLAAVLSTDHLRTIFSFFLFALALRIFFLKQLTSHRKLLSAYTSVLSGLIIGMISGLLGVGGGLLTVPFLIYCNVPMRRAAGTSAACGVPIAITGAITFMITGWHQPGLPNYSSGYIYWPAVLAIAISSMLSVYFGAFLSKRLPVKIIQQIFAFVLVLAGLKLFF